MRKPTDMTEEQIYADFSRMGIDYERLEHPAVFTVEDSAPIHEAIAAAHTKNLFLKDKRGGFWLIVLPSAKRADLRGIAEVVGAGKFSFAKPEDMTRLLGVEPGSVTPLAAAGAPAGSVQLVFDEGFRAHERIAVHPLRNTATIVVDFGRLLAWLSDRGVAVRVAVLP
ncbi:MAG: prolyl-tRNA synthetase associated domain-containing protein [Sphingomonas sp.]|uniref:prolyl-tRNA synthetase associated domain-containing protein n=1 Tax=Sphingomonas sp. TaxID=28214 RepID=UPI003F7F8277